MWKTHGFWLGQKLGYLTLYKLSSGWLFVLCLKNIFVMKANILFLKEKLKPDGNVTLKMKAPFCILLPQIIRIFVHVSLDFLPQHFKYLHLYFVEGFWNISITSHPFSKWLSQTPSSRAWNLDDLYPLETKSLRNLNTSLSWEKQPLAFSVFRVFTESILYMYKKWSN